MEESRILGEGGQAVTRIREETGVVEDGAAGASQVDRGRKWEVSVVPRSLRCQCLTRLAELTREWVLGAARGILGIFKETSLDVRKQLIILLIVTKIVTKLLEGGHQTIRCYQDIYQTVKGWHPDFQYWHQTVV